MWGARSGGGCPVQPLALGGRRDAHVWRSSDRRSTRERRSEQARGAALGKRRVRPERSSRASRHAGARRGRDDVGDPAQAHRSGRSAGHEPRCPSFRQRCLLLRVGRPAPRQASQEPGRVSPPPLLLFSGVRSEYVDRQENVIAIRNSDTGKARVGPGSGVPRGPVSIQPPDAPYTWLWQC